MTPTVAVIYVRVSDTSQAETDTDGGYSLSVQKQLSRLRASELGATRSKVFVEPGKSATTMRRPELEAAIARAMEPDVGWFIVHKVNRFARNASDGLRIADELKAHGTDLVSVAESWDNTPAGKLMKTIYFGLAEMYSAELSEEVTTKMAEKARRGGTPGNTPPGYKNVRVDVDGLTDVARVALDDERAHHIRWAFKQYATGNYTLSSMHAALIERGLTAKPTRRYPERPVSRTSLAKLLRNPYYIGIVTWGQKQYQGVHPKLIDEETFARVQKVLDTNNRAGDKSWRHRQYLKGTLYCGHCEGRMGYTHGRGKSGTRYEYFYCLGRQRKNGCPQRYIPAHLAEEAVERYYSVVHEKVGERLPPTIEAFAQLVGGFEENAAAEEIRQRATIEKLDRQRKKILHLSYDDAMPDDVVRGEMARITEEIGVATNTLEATQLNIGNLKDLFDELSTLMLHSDEAYRKGSDDRRRGLNQFWFKRLEIKEDEITNEQLADTPEFVLSPALRGELQELSGQLRGVKKRDQWDLAMEALTKEEPSDAHGTKGSNLSQLVDLEGQLLNSSEVLETLHLAGNLADGAARSVDEASWRTVRPVGEGESRSIAKRYEEGLTVPQLVVATGRNRATILRHLHQRGVETRHPGRKLTDEQVAAAADRYRRGETINAIAADLPVHKETLRKELVRAGVELRSGRFGQR